LAPELRGQTAAAEARLDVTAQILDFEPGFYAVEVVAPKTICGVSGMHVPCIRLDPILKGGGSRAFVSTMTDCALVDPEAPPAYLRITGGKVSVLLTIYKLTDGTSAPELRITLLQQAIPHSEAATPKPALASAPLRLMTHIERIGDMTVAGGIWAGQPGRSGALEGFAVTPSDGVPPEEIEYQAILGKDWTTPWLAGGEFCGSRGLSLPILGVRIRLRGNAAKTHQCSYWGKFANAGEFGPAVDGAVCANGGAAMESLRVVLTRRPELPVPLDQQATPSPAAPAAEHGLAADKETKTRVAVSKVPPPPADKNPGRPIRRPMMQGASSGPAAPARK
jgi:hypothetical protein